MSALVTDAYGRICLCITRSLGGKNIKVVCGDENKFAMSFYSKYCKNYFIYPSYRNEPTAFISELLRKVKFQRFDVIIPAGPPTTLLLSQYKTKFEKYTKVAVSEWPLISKVVDKAIMTRWAYTHNFPVPSTAYPEKTDDLRVLTKNLNYPVVIKPRRRGGSWGVCYAYTEKDLISKWNYVHETFGSFPVVQEYLCGPGLGVECLFNRGEPRAIFVHKRLREYPPSGGTSTLRESVDAPEIRNLGVKMLEELGWHGVAMVEFKLDNCGKPKFLEINPRFWGSLPLAVHSGVDFPWLYYQMLRDGDVKTVFKYTVGIKSRWTLWGDLIQLIQIFRSENKKFPKALADFFRFYGGKYDEISLDDPKPIVGNIIYHFNRIISDRGFEIFVRRRPTPNRLRSQYDLM